MSSSQVSPAVVVIVLILLIAILVALYFLYEYSRTAMPTTAESIAPHSSKSAPEAGAATREAHGEKALTGEADTGAASAKPPKPAAAPATAKGAPVTAAAEAKPAGSPPLGSKAKAGN